LLLSISLFVVYTVNLLWFDPGLAGYFDTPTLGRRHQLFGRVSFALGKEERACCLGLLAAHLGKRERARACSSFLGRVTLFSFHVFITPISVLECLGVGPRMSLSP
jgi:hypothetical protein